MQARSVLLSFLSKEEEEDQTPFISKISARSVSLNYTETSLKTELTHL